ncbi:hypothetical protein OKA05_02750 [Luteolibacter arcticus]|uniref:Uncharacterized protein n=1 Tax=Luteolibacter arcticus TaxID=1581411 RepID=A0ABT3GD28_9BACT|nr:hypothetical protein [Luteolibacter arcticus]MCW1921454.1 hypothetical protein [Luteolibacter arcticus]
MKLPGIVALVLCSASLAVAEEIKVEAVVIELPNRMADALASQGRKGDVEAWKKVVSPDGESLDKQNIKVIARFEVEQFNDGRGLQTVTHEEDGGISVNYSYRVEVKNPEESTRWIGINTVKGKAYLETWSFDLSAPLSADWNFSARHRTKEKSRIVLEKSPGLAELEEKGDAKWTAARLLLRDSAVNKRETKIDAAAFLDDPSEFYRVEWRHRPGDGRLAHQDNRDMSTGGSVLEIKEKRDYPMHGERTHFFRKAGALSGMVRSEKDGGGKGSKLKVISIDYDRAPTTEADPLPLAVQRPTEQTETTWKGNLGEGKKQSSKTHVQIIAE